MKISWLLFFIGLGLILGFPIDGKTSILFSGKYLNSPVHLEILGGSGEPGSSGNIVSIFLENEYPISEMEFQVFDSTGFLTPSGVNLKSRVQGFEVNINQDGIISIKNKKAFLIVPDSSVILEIIYDVSPDAYLNEITLKFRSAIVLDDNRQPFANIDLISGKFIIPNPTPTVILSIGNGSGYNTGSSDISIFSNITHNKLEFHLANEPNVLKIINFEKFDIINNCTLSLIGDNQIILEGKIPAGNYKILKVTFQLDSAFNLDSILLKLLNIEAYQLNSLPVTKIISQNGHFSLVKARLSLGTGAGSSDNFQIPVPLYFDNRIKIKRLLFRIMDQYNAVTIVGDSLTSRLFGMTISSQLDSQQYVVSGSGNINPGNGKILDLFFKIRANSYIGIDSLFLTNVSAFDENNNLIFVETVNNLISIAKPNETEVFKTTIEAEEMEGRYTWFGSPCEDGWKITHDNHAIYEKIFIPNDSIYHITVVAKAEKAGTSAPWLKIELGSFVAACPINGTEWDNYTFFTSLNADSQLLKISFLNDWWHQPDDRNLLVDKVIIKDKEIKDFVDNSYTFEAEAMAHPYGVINQENQICKLYKQYSYIEQEIFFENSMLNFQIIAKADSASHSWPKMNILIDKSLKASFIVDDSNFKTYQTLISDLTPGYHLIKIAYEPESYGYQRNLYIDKLIVYTTTENLLKSESMISLINEFKTSNPIEYKLYPNYPNPFNSQTLISYSIAKSALVKLNIYNTMGQKIKTLVNMYETAGNHSIVWNGTDDFNNLVSSGIYFYKIESDDFINFNKIIYLK